MRRHPGVCSLMRRASSSLASTVSAPGSNPCALCCFALVFESVRMSLQPAERRAIGPCPTVCFLTFFACEGRFAALRWARVRSRISRSRSTPSTLSYHSRHIDRHPAAHIGRRGSRLHVPAPLPPHPHHAHSRDAPPLLGNDPHVGPSEHHEPEPGRELLHQVSNLPPRCEWKRHGRTAFGSGGSVRRLSRDSHGAIAITADEAVRPPPPARLSSASQSRARANR